jgi:hypothetical protein
MHFVCVWFEMKESGLDITVTRKMILNYCNETLLLSLGYEVLCWNVFYPHTCGLLYCDSYYTFT